MLKTISPYRCPANGPQPTLRTWLLSTGGSVYQIGAFRSLDAKGPRPEGENRYHLLVVAHGRNEQAIPPEAQVLTLDWTGRKGGSKDQPVTINLRSCADCGAKVSVRIEPLRAGQAPPKAWLDEHLPTCGWRLKWEARIPTLR